MSHSSTLVFGGMFDPIHLGHLQVAQTVQQHFHCTSCLFTPCFLPVHKTHPTTMASQRIHMLSLALEDVSIENASICLEEIQRSTPSYTVNTLQSLRRSCSQQESIIFLMGFDSFLTFMTWHQPALILKLAHLLVIQRPGMPLLLPTALQTLLKTHQTDDATTLLVQPNGHIYFFNAGVHPESSRQIRSKIQQHQPYEHLLSASVSDYIKQEKLYL